MLLPNVVEQEIRLFVISTCLKCEPAIRSLNRIERDLDSFVTLTCSKGELTVRSFNRILLNEFRRSDTRSSP